MSYTYDGFFLGIHQGITFEGLVASKSPSKWLADGDAALLKQIPERWAALLGIRI